MENNIDRKQLPLERCKPEKTLYAAFMNSIIAEIPVLNRVPSISSVTWK